MLRALIAFLGLSAGMAHADGTKSKHSMKGWELRSWLDRDGSCIAPARSGVDPSWCFSLLFGTNRNKTHDEVVKSKVSEEELLRELGELKSGEEIYWMIDGRDFQLPGEPMCLRVEKAAERLGLKLHKH